MSDQMTKKIEKWIKSQEEAGRTGDDICRETLIIGTTVIRLSKSGKRKFNLKITVGCIDLDKKEEIAI